MNNTVNPLREKRWWEDIGSRRLSVAGSHVVTWGDKAHDGWTSEGLKAFVLLG